MEKIKWSEKVTNEQVLDSIGEKRTLLNNILCRKSNFNFRLYDVQWGKIQNSMRLYEYFTFGRPPARMSLT